VQIINRDEITFNAFSYRDPNGRLFEWQSGLYRGINDCYEPLCNHLIDKGIVAELCSAGLLIDTWVAPFHVEGFKLVVEHRQLPFVSFGFEWSAGMLKAAALLMLDLNIALANHGLSAPDIHPANILFDAVKPVYIDFTAIQEAPDNEHIWPFSAQQCFRQFFLYPLYLMSKGHHRIAHWLLHDFDNGVLESEYSEICNHKSIKSEGVFTFITKYMRRIPSAVHHIFNQQNTSRQFGVSELHRMRREIESIDVSFTPNEWTDYYLDDFPSFIPSDDWGFKRKNVYDTIIRLHPSSVIDIGSNRGWYSQLAASLGINVVALELEESSVDLLFNDALTRELPILPLIMNIKSPSGGYGLCNNWLLPASARLKCDLVICLALTHHLALRECLNFDQIAQALKQFSNRWLIVEFVPREDRWGREMWTPKFPEYTLDNFEKSLRSHFTSVELLGTAPDTRSLLFCEI
jgi:hypothetical protein